MSAPAVRFRSFRDFYPFYISEHASRTSRRLHVVGTGGALVFVALGALVSPRLFWLAPLAGYGLAWVGHFRFERNRPATFRYPLFSLLGDLRLFGEVMSGRRPW